MRYNRCVFFFGGWKEIYTTDDERKMSFESAKLFGEDAGRVYEELGYSIVEVPHVPVSDRVEFVCSKIQEFTECDTQNRASG